MPNTHNTEYDLNLLKTLQVLLEERHITRAAERCFLSQPAMSRALDRLRKMFQDELLIRSGSTYRRTVRGERLLQELKTLLPRIDSIVRGKDFTPSQSQESFRLSMTDFAAVVLLPPLTREFHTHAPFMKIEIIAHSENVFENLESGRIDLAFEAAASIPGIESQVLFEEDFICLHASSKIFRRKQLLLDEYLKHKHIMVNVRAGRQTLVDRPLSDLGLQRNIGLRAPYFIPAILAIPGTDYLLTIPRRLTKLAKSIHGISIIEAPAELKSFKYMMAWHSRLSAEPAHQWLRSKIQAIANRA